VIRHKRGPKAKPITEMFAEKLKDMRPITGPIADRLKETARRDLWPTSKIRAKGLKKAASITRTMRDHKARFPNPKRFMLSQDDLEWAADVAAEWLGEE
jgi:hypothetical protein